MPAFKYIFKKYNKSDKSDIFDACVGVMLICQDALISQLDSFLSNHFQAEPFDLKRSFFLLQFSFRNFALKSNFLFIEMLN